uniref:Uncharacterized protein n=1 Tax=Acrobeloides nanus TaxID=290746 RepID=A0A914E5J5_9BILA
MNDLGGINLKVSIALVIAWITTALVLWKGVKIIGRVALFTSTTPYIIIAIMFIQSWTLEGHTKGLDFYLLRPDFSVVFKWETWKSAVTQNCYSLGIGFGGLLSLASFNKKNHNCFRDAMLVSFADGFMSIFGGVAVFNVLGFMATRLNLRINDVVQSGTGLAFIAYPEAISHMPVPWLWALLFFVMLWLLGVDSQFGLVEVICTSLRDQFPSLKKYEGLLVFTTCFVSFLVGIIMTTKAGIFYFTVFDEYSASLGLIVLLLLEITLVVFVYGCANYIDDIRMMFGQPKNLLGKLFGPSGWYIKIVWLTVSPIFATAILIVTIMSTFTKQMTYGKDDRKYSYPTYAYTIGWVLSLLPLVAIPILIWFKVHKFKKEGKSMRELFRLQPKWPSYKLHSKNRAHSVLPGWLANIIGFNDNRSSLYMDSKF